MKAASGSTARIRLLVLIAFLIGLVIAGIFLPVRDYLEAFLKWIQDQGEVWGLVLLAASYTPASLLLFPGSLLTLGGGALFGVIKGTIAISIGSTVAAGVAFLVGRWLARDWVAKKVADSARFQALDRAVAEQGFKIVLLTRLSPAFPFTILNYAYGLTRVSFRNYILASWIGMFPGTVMYVYLGSAARNLAEIFAGDTPDNPYRKIFFFVGLLATIVVTVLVTRMARKALRTTLEENTPEQTSLTTGENHG